MQRTPPESSPARADYVTPVFLRMPTVMRITGLGRIRGLEPLDAVVPDRLQVHEPLFRVVHPAVPDVHAVVSHADLHGKHSEWTLPMWSGQSPTNARSAPLGSMLVSRLVSAATALLNNADAPGKWPGRSGSVGRRCAVAD